MIADFCILCTLFMMCFWLHDTKKYEMEDSAYAEPTPVSEEEGIILLSVMDNNTLEIKYPDAMFIGKYDSGDFVLTPMLFQYKVENVSGRSIKITLSDTGLPYVQEYYEIRYSQNEDISRAKCKIMDGRSMMLNGLIKGKRYYIEFRWGSDEGNEGKREPFSSQKNHNKVPD